MNRGDVGAFADQRLALAVVAEPPGFENRRTTELGDRTHQRPRILDADKGRDLMPKVAQKGLLCEPILGQRQRADARTDWHASAEKFDRRGRHVLELIGDDVDALRETGERRLVVEGGDGARRGGVIGGRRLLGGEDVSAQADFERRHRQHAPKLPGARCRSSRRDLKSSPGGLGRHAVTRGTLGDFGRALGPPRREARRELFVAQRQHGRGEQRRVDRAWLADRQRPDRNAGRHLDDRKKAVHA